MARDRVRRAGSTDFPIEQDAWPALTMADRACVLEPGRIQLAEEVRELPESGALASARLPVS